MRCIILISRVTHTSIAMRLLSPHFSLLLLLSTFVIFYIPLSEKARATPDFNTQETAFRKSALDFSDERKAKKTAPPLITQTPSDEMKQQLIIEAEQLHQQSKQLSQQGRISEAIPISVSALSMLEKAVGKEHLAVATILYNLAGLYKSQGLYAKAEPLYQRALDIEEKALGKEHPDVANSLNNLAEVYRSQGLFDQANPLYIRALSIQEKALGKTHPSVATGLNNLALSYSTQGFYSKAEPLYQRALHIYTAAIGKEHPLFANSLNNLASLYKSQGLYSKATPLYQQALGIRENALGKEHPDVATSLNDLALLYITQGLHTKAEPLLQRALSIRENTLGEEHPLVAGSLSNLAGLYHSQGFYTKAISLYQKAVSTQENALGKEHPDVANSLNNLAHVYKSQALYSKAEPLFQRALDIDEKALGKEHPTFATKLNNLADLYITQGLYSKAEPLCQRALNIRKNALGEEHPDVANSLNNLGVIYTFQQLETKAEPLFQRALDIQENVLGKTHPDVKQSLTNLASLHHSQGNLSLAHQFYARAADIEERNLGLTLSTISEARKRAYITTLSGTTNASISLSLKDAPQSLPSAQLALNTILRRKGRVLASLTNTFQTLKQNLDPADRPLFDQLSDIRAQQAALTFQRPGPLSPKQHQTILNQLKTQEEGLENQLARKSFDLKVETQPVTVATVQQHIPQETALVELVKYKPFDLQASKREFQWGKTHYAAYILRSDGDLQWVNLGEAHPIDQAVTQFRQALKSDTSDIRPIARKLDQQLMQPIRAKLGDTKQLLLSPDSQLNLIPFAALVDENNQYLVENYDITYLSSGRDLLKLDPTVQTKQELQAPVIIANPDYQQAGTPKIAAAQKSDNRSSRDLNLTFGPLPGTKKEAEQLHKLLPKSTVLTDAQATENALKQIQSPEILHIATHGFFLETDLEAAPDPDANRGSINVIAKENPQPQQQKNNENPLLRSGLALAGANPRKSGTEDGIFTALEATGLDLRGTKLVVLSACETGLGDIANGEGVYGLRRAFVMTGAESQVLSLWKVSDEGTKDLMASYYQRLLNKEGRSEAMRNTQLTMLKNAKYQHPFYWAAFIPSGDWKPMVQ